jgi:hypothetical protein
MNFYHHLSPLTRTGAEPFLKVYVKKAQMTESAFLGYADNFGVRVL